MRKPLLLLSLIVPFVISCNSQTSTPDSVATQEQKHDAAEPETRSDVITTGMAMASATDILRDHGLQPEQMAFSGNHFAYTLPDGRALVLLGDDVVQSILLIHNPDQPKAFRTDEYVEEFAF